MDLNEDLFNQPIPRYNNDKPLTGCVITISGYPSQERESMETLCKLLGALTQASLCLKSYNNILPNTHLICKTAIGPKYIAAKSWNLPIVIAEWLAECCVTGMKADENKYIVGSQANLSDLIEALNNIRRNEEISSTNGSSATSSKMKENDSTLLLMNGGNFSRFGGKIERKLEDEDEDVNDDDDINCDDVISYPSETKKPRLDKRNSGEGFAKAQDSFHNNSSIRYEKDDDATKLQNENNSKHISIKFNFIFILIQNSIIRTFYNHSNLGPDYRILPYLIFI